MESFFEAASSVAIYVALISLILNMILLVLFIVFGVKHRKLEDRIDALTRGTDGESLEAILRSVLEDNQKVKIQLKNNVDEIVRINENLLTAYRKTGLVKYNAFPGMAGKVSAVICLLNNENNGIIINTIHGQDGCYTYVKEIMNGKSINPLTKEDEEALKIALQMEI
ncbi:MAG: DUF4446 family protein [Lachnospiraceae bacterium]|nr:DUF4446 family protein [Lachnospiraceae bacterium]